MGCPPLRTKGWGVHTRHVSPKEGFHIVSFFAFIFSVKCHLFRRDDLVNDHKLPSVIMDSNGETERTTLRLV